MTQIVEVVGAELATFKQQTLAAIKQEVLKVEGSWVEGLAEPVMAQILDAVAAHMATLGYRAARVVKK